MILRFMLCFAGNVVSGRFISGCEIAVLCDILGCPKASFRFVEKPLFPPQHCDDNCTVPIATYAAK